MEEAEACKPNPYSNRQQMETASLTLPSEHLSSHPEISAALNPHPGYLVIVECSGLNATSVSPLYLEGSETITGKGCGNTGRL